MLRMLNRLEECLIGALICAATAIVFVAVIHRYGLSNAVQLMVFAKSNGLEWLTPIARGIFKFFNSVRMPWVQELCIFMFIWMAKFGAAYGVRTGIHVGVDILVERLSVDWKRRMILVGLAGGSLFTAIIAALGARLVLHISEMGQTSQVLEIPMWIVYLAIPLGSALMCFRFLETAWNFYSNGTLPRHDFAHIEGLDETSRGASP